MSQETTCALKKYAVELARSRGLDVQDVITEFVACTLITTESDPAHMEGMRFAREIERAMLSAHAVHTHPA